MKSNNQHFAFLILVLFLSITCYGQKEKEQLIRRYFKAFNQSNYSELKPILAPDFSMNEGAVEICNNRQNFRYVFQWDSVFKPNYNIDKIKITEKGADVLISKSDVRVEFLHDEAMVSNIRVEIDNGKIKKLSINDYKKFDRQKWRGRLNSLSNCVSDNHPELNGFDTNLTLHGARNFLKAIELYAQRKLSKEEKIFIDKNLQLVHLKDSVFVHISWHSFNGSKRFPSNGLIIVKNGDAIIVDTPFTNQKTKSLYAYLKDKMNVKITHHIAGHFHDDCMGGIDFLHQQGVHTIANKLTFEKCLSLGLPLPKEQFDKINQFSFNGSSVELRYFGGAHSFDNITVWIPDSEILFGGCMIKPIGAKGMGNLNDAVLSEWDTTVIKVKQTYPKVKFVIPGHGLYGDANLLSYTIDLVKKYKQNNGIK